MRACWSCGELGPCTGYCVCAKCEDPEGYQRWKETRPEEYQNWLDSQERTDYDWDEDETVWE